MLYLVFVSSVLSEWYVLLRQLLISSCQNSLRITAFTVSGTASDINANITNLRCFEFAYRHNLQSAFFCGVASLQGERDGLWAWQRINQLFNWLPLAALIEKKIICMHGGIGRSINHVNQIEALQRPITMDAGSVVLMDLLW